MQHAYAVDIVAWLAWLKSRVPVPVLPCSLFDVCVVALELELELALEQALELALEWSWPRTDCCSVVAVTSML